MSLHLEKRGEAMKGILMTPANHLATRKKIKTMTRRLDGLKEINKEPDKWSFTHFMPDYSRVEFSRHFSLTENIWVKPRYRVGEVVYIKEAWAIKHTSQSFSPKLDDIVQVIFINGEISKRYGDICYNADGSRWLLSVSKAYDTGEWQSPMFLPELCARDFIKITKVGIGRLQDITEEEAKNEGANPYLVDKLSGGKHYRMLKTYHHDCYPLIDHADEGEEVVFECPNMGFARLHHIKWVEKQDPVFRIPAKEAFEYVGALEPDYINGFKILWNSINGKKYPYDSNPWVWEISYELLESK